MHNYRQVLEAAVSYDIPSTNELMAQPALFGDHSLNGSVTLSQNVKPAAVLVPIVERPEGVSMLLTVRASHLPEHSGQVAFPGGKVELADKNPPAAALRETYEEIGIREEYISILGCIDAYQTVTAYRVIPILGFVSPDFSLTIDTNEVADVFEVPLDFILDQRNHKLETRQFQGYTRHFYAMNYGDYFIWGATAGMIRNLTERMKV